MSNQDYQQFTATFNIDEVPQLYSDWEWLVNPMMLSQPLAMSYFGDLFYKDSAGKVHFLDTIEGKTSQVADNEDEWKIMLNSEDNQKLFLSSENVKLLTEGGLVLKENELYTFVPHPILTGRIDLNTAQAMSMNVVISLMGQLLNQMRS